MTAIVIIIMVGWAIGIILANIKADRELQEEKAAYLQAKDKFDQMNRPSFYNINREKRK